jgi:hypothetical protein
MAMPPLPDFDNFVGTAISALENPEEAVAATAALLTSDRGTDMPVIKPAPDTHLQLEQGLQINGEFHRDAEVRELSGLDEEALARCGADSAKLLETLVIRGTRTVGTQSMSKTVADQLLIGDREALILGIRRVTFGETVDFENLPCPHCGERSDVQFALDEVPVRHLEDPEQTEFAVPLRHGATGYVRLPNGADQMAIRSLNTTLDAVQNSLMLGRCILRVEHADGSTSKASAELPKTLPMGDRFTLMNFLIDTQPGPRFNDCKFVHEVCDQEVALPLTLAMLFR